MARTDEMALSSERRAFGLYLRTGRVPIAAMGVETKSNPYHDPQNGRFTFGPSATAAALRSAAKVSKDGPLGPVRVVKLDPITSSDLATMHAIAATPSIVNAMDRAWANSLATGKEYGFFIYYDGDGAYSAGPMVGGDQGDMSDELYDSRINANPAAGISSSRVAVFHTHPGDYANADNADNYDQNFGKRENTIIIIRTKNRFIVGR